MTDRVFVLGAGRAGMGLARALRASGVDIVGLHGRHAGGPDGVTAGAVPDAIARANVVLVTVRDGQLDGALRELSAAPLAPGAVVLHASGSAEPAALGELRARGHPAGTFHPLAPLADAGAAARQLRGAWIGIDGDPAARDAAERLARALGAHTLVIPAGEKPRYHAAAVLASNFPAVLLALGERLLRDAGLPPAVAGEALRPLFQGAAENLRALSGARALTGPIVRGDVDTVRRHLQVLAAEPDVLAVYRALSLAALDVARAAGADPERLAAIEASLAPRVIDSTSM